MTTIKPVTGEQPSPFHPGERAVQTSAGVRDEAEKRGLRMLTADLNEQQVRFFQALSFLITGHTDETGQPWAGLLTGQPGFVSVEPEKYRCTINPEKATNLTGPVVSPGDAIGLLGIELPTRRRNRLNGSVISASPQQWQIQIEQGYGNCPKYITEREWPAQRFAQSYSLQASSGLSADALALARNSDTFFIATASGPRYSDTATQTSAWGADVSHRGGEPGFLEGENNQLRFADFPGNNMFNTLGNISQHPQCGILLLDFDSGELVQLACKGTIVPQGETRSITLDISATRHWRPVPAH